MTEIVCVAESEIDPAVRAIALFSALIHAWRSNNFADALYAKQELEQIGVQIKIASRSTMRKDVCHWK